MPVVNQLAAWAGGAAARVPRSAVRAAGAALATLTTLFVVLEIVRQWDELTAVVRTANPWWLVVSGLVFAVGEVAYAFAWPATLRRAGHPVAPGAAGAAFLVTQSAKFVPGSVWQHVGRIGTSERLGVPKRVVAGSMVVEVASSVAAALFLAGVVGTVVPLVVDDPGPAWRAVELAAAVAAVVVVPEIGRRVAGRVGGSPLIERGPLAVIVAWHVAVWATYGVGAGMLSIGLGGPLWPAVGAFTFSWVCGLVVVGAPAGLGVREAVMAASLTPVAGADVALAVTVGSRAVWTVVQLAGAGVGVAFLSRRRARSAGEEPAASAAPDDAAPPVPC